MIKNIWSELQPNTYIKSIVYGGLDGIITIFAMVSSNYGVRLSPIILLIMGFANLCADGLSMSISDYLSSKAESDRERFRQEKLSIEFEKDSENQKQKVIDIFLARGFSFQDANTLGSILIKDKLSIIQILLQEDQEKEESPIRSAIWTLISFICFGFIPLLSYILSPLFSFIIGPDKSGITDFCITSLLAIITLWFLGNLKGKITQGSSSSWEMVLVGITAAALAYFIATILWEFSSSTEDNS